MIKCHLGSLGLVTFFRKTVEAPPKCINGHHPVKTQAIDTAKCYVTTFDGSFY